jgi:putative protease
MLLPELLAPAGDYEKLVTAYAYGADAAYVGFERYGLRAMAANFNVDELARARDLAARLDRRLYLTLNAYIDSAECDVLAADLERLRGLDFDAYIVADPGVLALVRQLDPDRSVHLSTQANTTNLEAVRFWQQNGVARVNLARESTLADLKAIRRGCTAELEVFVHGAMCVAHSGRCLLSAAMTGRSANRGACTQPCRWNYHLVEATRPHESFPIEQDEHGTYLLNSRDLCLLEYLPELITAGVDSLKIEGRMKSLYYVAATVSVYRAALDSYAADPQGWSCDPRWRDELDKVSHRPYSSGFLFGRDDANIHADDSRYRRSYEFVGRVLAVDTDGRGLVEGRNRFFPGEQVELFGPGLRHMEFTIETPYTEAGEPLTVVQPNARVMMPLPASAAVGDLLRKAKAVSA